MEHGLDSVDKLSEEGLEEALSLLNTEQTKKLFLLGMSDEILFDYNAREDTMTFSKGGTRVLGVASVISKVSRFSHKLAFLSECDSEAVWQAFLSARPGEAALLRQCEVMLPEDMSGWFDIRIHVLWTQEAPQQVMGFVGKLSLVCE